MSRVIVENDDGTSQEFDGSKVVVLGVDQRHDREIVAMSEIIRVMDALAPAERQNVVRYVAERFGAAEMGKQT